MATTRGVNNTLAQPGTGIASVPGGDGGGKVAGFYDERVVTAADLIAGVIVMGPDKALKKGDRVIAVRFDFEACGAGCTIAVGDDGSSNRYQAANDVSAAGQNAVLKNGALGYVLTQDRDMQLLIAGANPTVGAKLRLHWSVLRA